MRLTTPAQLAPGVVLASSAWAPVVASAQKARPLPLARAVSARWTVRLTWAASAPLPPPQPASTSTATAGTTANRARVAVTRETLPNRFATMPRPSNVKGTLDDRGPPAATAVHRRDGRAEGAGRRGRLEQPRPAAGFAGL